LSNEGDQLWVAQLEDACVAIRHDGRISPIICQHRTVKIVTGDTELNSSQQPTESRCVGGFSKCTHPSGIFIIHVKLLLFANIGWGT
jgi:hypothetical protein